jgi:phosphohistidine phosphatase SixA
MYGASLDMLLTLAEDAFSYSERLMMVGHNPGIRDLLVSILRPDQTASIRKMDPGTLAIIEFPDQFKRHTPAGNLIHLIRRDELSING